MGRRYSLSDLLFLKDELSVINLRLLLKIHANKVLFLVILTSHLPRVGLVIDKIANEITKHSGIKCDTRSVLKILSAIRKSNNIWMISTLSREPLVLVSKAIPILANWGLIEYTDGDIKPRDLGLKILKDEGYEENDHTCKVCSGRGIITSHMPPDAIREYTKIAASRPRPLQKYDQAFVTCETAFARVAIMDHYGDIKGRRILLIGDDDLISIAIGLLGKAKKITVIEVDERLAKYISKVSREYGLDIDVDIRDITDPLPENMLHSYDTFHADPPEPIEAIRLFVGRGIAALTTRGAGYVSLSLIDSSIYKWQEVQRILTVEFQVVITDIIRDFNVYQNWEYLESMKIWNMLPTRQKPPEGWYRTALMRIETLEGSRGTNEKISAEIYSDVENISQ